MIRKVFVMGLLLSFIIESHAALFNVSGSFSGSNFVDDGGVATPPVDSFGGTFSFQFDDADVSSSGSTRLNNFIPTEVDISVNGLLFDESNTLVTANFRNGSLSDFFVGGIPGGANGIGAGNNDIAIGFFSGEVSTLVYTLLNDPGRYRSRPPDLTGSYTVSSVSSVPVPAAVWLFGTALVGLAGFSKRRQAA